MTPAALDYAALWSRWSWRNQLDIWFQLAKVWLANFNLLIPHDRNLDPK